MCGLHLSAQGQVRVQVSVDTARRVVTIAPVEGGADVAVSMIDRRISTPDTVTTIASQLLLQSDLRGHVEDAGWYLRGDGRQTAPAADALMLTQGWTRYDLSAVVKGQMADSLEYPLEVGAQLDGVIRSKWRGKPLAGATANVLAPRMADGATAVTDAQGRFHITGLEWPDSTTLVIRAVNSKGIIEENFSTEFDSYPDIKALKAGMAANLPDTEEEAETYLDRLNASQQGVQISLKEVVVKGRRSGDSDNAIDILASVNVYVDDNPDIKSYAEVVRNIPGVNVINDELRYHNMPVSIWVDGRYLGSAPSWINAYRAASSSYGVWHIRDLSDPGLFSGSMTLSDLEGMHPYITAKSVAYIPPHFAMLFRHGRMAQGGVLAVTTKNPGKIPNTLSREFKAFRPLGYQKSKTFYSPKYTPDGVASQSGATLQWYPSIDIANDVELPLPPGMTANDITVTVEGITPNGATVEASQK